MNNVFFDLETALEVIADYQEAVATVFSTFIFPPRAKMVTGLPKDKKALGIHYAIFCFERTSYVHQTTLQEARYKLEKQLKQHDVLWGSRTFLHAIDNFYAINDALEVTIHDLAGEGLERLDKKLEQPLSWLRMDDFKELPEICFAAYNRDYVIEGELGCACDGVTNVLRQYFS